MFFCIDTQVIWNATAMNLNKYKVLVRAGVRLSPRMVRFMLRRTARNRLAAAFPSWYSRRIQKILEWVPDLSNFDIVSEAVSETAHFYCAEYESIIDEVLEGKIRLHGRQIDFGSPENVVWKTRIPDEGDHQMWAVKLGHMGFLCPMLLSGSSRHRDTVAALISSFRKTTSITDKNAFTSYWFPYGVSHRILALTSGYIIAKNKGIISRNLEDQITIFLRENVAFLLDNVEHELDNNHVERNLAALCLYYSHVQSVPRRVADKLESEISYILSRTILEDGSQVERSPMYQGLSIVSLHIMAAAPFLSAQLRAVLTVALEKARRAFAFMCHPDGNVALFNDSWHHEVPKWNGAVAASGRTILPDAGYARVSEGQDLCLLDAGAIGPAWNPGHGHADFLSIEVTLAGERLIVDPGTSRYNTGAARQRERSAAAHNGPFWLGHEPVEFLGCFKVGRMAEANLLPIDSLGEYTVGGFFRNGPGVVLRAVRLYPGKGFLVTDLWSTCAVAGQVNWLIPDNWRIEFDDSRVHLVHYGAGVSALVQPLSGGGSFEFVRSHWACCYGKCEEASEIRMKARNAGDFQILKTWIGFGEASREIIADSTELVEVLYKHIRVK